MDFFVLKKPAYGTSSIYLSGSPLGLRIGSLDSLADDQPLHEKSNTSAVYSQGYIMIQRGTTLVARPFEMKSMSFTGEAVSVAEQIQAANSTPGRFSVSTNGVLVYDESDRRNLRLTWLDRAGQRLGTVGDAGDFDSLEFSPDRRTLAVAMGAAAGGDIWLQDISRGLRTRFTFDPADDWAPVWSPDGRNIIFSSNRNGIGDLYRKPADASRNEELLYADSLGKIPSSFSPSGKFLAYSAVGDPKTKIDIWILPDPMGPPGVSKPYQFLHSEFNETDARFSPDGRWISFVLDESGKDEVYVVPFPGPGGKQQVSTSGGAGARWRPYGKELFYREGTRLMAAEVDTKGSAFDVKRVTPMFGPVNSSYDVSGGCQRFLVLLTQEGETPETILTVVQNWTAGLKK